MPEVKTSREQENRPMNVVYDDRSKQVKEYFTLLQQATERLKDVLGPSSGLVKAKWDRIEDERGRSLYSLTLSDFTGEAEARFAPDELQNSTHMRVRLYKLWGDLLQDRNRKQMKELQEPIDTGE
jgi:hypothetical protein